MPHGLASEEDAASDSKVVENHKRFGNKHTQAMANLTLNRAAKLAEPTDHKSKKNQTKHSGVNDMTDSETPGTRALGRLA